MQIKLITVTAVLLVADIFHALPLGDPWFDLLIIYLFLKILVSGMPEPTIKSSDSYVWMYRSLHMLALIPTRYFANKSFWHTFEDKDAPIFPRDD